MIASYKRKANIAGAIVLATFIGAFVLGLVLRWTGYNTEKNIDALAIAWAVPFGASFFYGLWAYLKAKGRSSAWLFMLTFQVIGIIVILLLKDHAKDGQPPAPPAPQEYFG